MRLPLPILLFALSAPAQDLSQPQIYKVAAGYLYTEGPAWSRDGYLIFSDAPANQLLRIKPAEKAAPFREKSNGAMGNAFDSQGRLYTCETHARRITRTDKKGKIEVLAERYQGKRFNAPNDIVVRKDGHAYFTDPAFGNQEDTRDLDFYGVYTLTPRGELELIAKPKGRPNGVALSPDGRILYVTNSDERNVRAYDLDRSGAASNERVLVPSVDGIPGGVRTDEKGNLYVAADRIEVYTPQGKPLGSISLAEKPSNCAFGGDDMQSLFITARTSVYRVHLDVKGSAQY